MFDEFVSFWENLKMFDKFFLYGKCLVNLFFLGKYLVNFLFFWKFLVFFFLRKYLVNFIFVWHIFGKFYFFLVNLRFLKNENKIAIYLDEERFGWLFGKRPSLISWYHEVQHIRSYWKHRPICSNFENYWKFGDTVFRAWPKKVDLIEQFRHSCWFRPGILECNEQQWLPIVDGPRYLRKFLHCSMSLKIFVFKMFRKISEKNWKSELKTSVEKWKNWKSQLKISNLKKLKISSTLY